VKNTTSLGKPKWLVNTVELNGDYLAFADKIMEGFGAQNEVIGESELELGIVGLYDFDLGFTRVFFTRTKDHDLTFTYDFDKKEFQDEQTNSTWNNKGLAIDGELEGEQLTQLDAPEMFWFCWYDTHPDTEMARLTSNGDLE
jgi:hypothetical protein